MQSILDPGEPGDQHARPAPAGRGLQWISITHGVSAPLRVSPLLPTTLSLCVKTVELEMWWTTYPVPWLHFMWSGFQRSGSLHQNWTERQVAGRFCCFGFSGSWAAGEVLEAEFPGDWAPHRSWHWETFIFFDSACYLLEELKVSWEGKIASKMGFVTRARGTETRSRGHGATERNFRVLSHVLMPQGKWYTH